jgi:hypothetical protein
MLTCPMCKKKLRGLEKECVNCKTDVSLLVDYVENLQEGLVRAEALTKAGELGEAVWAYLEVLEVDPDNATARRRVGQVVTAVRQFDNAAPGRRWLKKLQRQTRFRRWAAGWDREDWTTWLTWAFWFVAIVAAVFVGFLVGTNVRPPAPPSNPPGNEAPDKQDKDRPDKPGKAQPAQG